MRHDGRNHSELRNVSIEPNFISQSLGSALICAGKTRVICTANVESKTPPWLENGGWVTAEYAMLPGSTSTRSRRDPGGRGKEIARLIGRSLRASTDLSGLVGTNGPLSLICDCDVIEADGGTRTASITGSYVALRIALNKLVASGRLASMPSIQALAAISVGMIESGRERSDLQAVVDLDYVEDSSAAVDLNVVMAGSNAESLGLVEVQGTAERQSFSRVQLDSMLDLASTAIGRLMKLQQAALKQVGIK